jgi:cytochrome o ubiquinol oxidase operon protein cyoD
MSERSRQTTSYVIGYALALILTAGAFALVQARVFTAAMTFGMILALALVQMIVHFRFFLHISLKKSSRHDLQLILFAGLIIALMVSGTLVILFNLRGRMM